MEQEGPDAAPLPGGATFHKEQTNRGAGMVTPRSVALGLLMSAIIVGMTQALSIQHSAAEVGGGAPAPAPTYILFLYVLLAAPLLAGRSRRIGLSRGELLLIYAMMLIAGPITHPFSIGFLIPHTVAPLYYNANEPNWALFEGVLPGWMGPSDPAAIKAFFQGGNGTVPWETWLLPMLAWSSLLIVLFWVMLCINVLMRRQWIENERLVFPLTAIPLALTQGEQSSFLHDPLRPTRQPLFWLGLVAVLLIQSPGRLHTYVPSFPDLQTQNLILVSASLLPAPWRGMGDIEFHLIFWLIGIVYLLPKEIALSCWVFYFVGLLENVTAVAIGTASTRPDVYSNDFPALYAQGAGAAFALTGITLWMARRHLRDIFHKAFHPNYATNDRSEYLSYRTAFVGAILGSAFILGWMCLAGMRLWVAGLFFALMLSYFFIFARIRAETGLGMGVILWPKMLNEVMITLVGAQSLRLSELTALFAMRWLYFGSATGSVMACQLEGFKLADTGGLRGRGVGTALLLAALITVPLAFLWTLATYYAHGFQALPIGQQSTSMVGSQIYWSYQNLVSAHSGATGPDLGGITAIGAGALVTVALSILRSRFLGFSLHPVGYLAANSWGMQIHWLSFLIGWLLNVLINRYGGLRVYQRLLPLFLGLIVGDMLHEGLWGMVAWMTGGTTP